MFCVTTAAYYMNLSMTWPYYTKYCALVRCHITGQLLETGTAQGTEGSCGARVIKCLPLLM